MSAFTSTRPGRLRATTRIAMVLIILSPLSLARPGRAETVDLGSVLEEVRSRTGVPAVVAAAIQDGRIIAQGAAGVRAKGDATNVSVDDPFLIGSCAKSMMRLLVARLADAGVLSFDTTLGAALDDTPMREEYRNVTIRQLLAHRGGIQPYTQIGPRLTPWLFELTGTPVEQRRAFAAHVLGEAPAAAPGTQEIYSNAGFGIVAHVAERLAGKPWEQLVAEQIFAPLGMATAKVGLPTSREHPQGVRGHLRGPNGYELDPNWRQPLAGIAPAGMVSCSVLDFARLAGALVSVEAGRSAGFLSETAAAGARETMPGGASLEAVPFFGGEGTFTAAFALWPSRRLAIVVETNGGESDEVGQAAIDAVRARVAPEASTTPPLDRGGDGATPPTGRPMLGIKLQILNDDLEVSEVLPGGLAEASGVRAGDVIQEINGKPAATMEPEERLAALREPKVVLTIRRDGAEIAIPLVRKAP